ncbi:MAG: putative DNA-binding domain-containing protein [Alphaproteobacteria bacterium]|nr:putative DNA-binding domain-containing protein [Alphaproteobacteria bacterium]MDE2339776.1 putative DNA-binding domain-containing protein [Alphaproteobacteria bacterium]
MSLSALQRAMGDFLVDATANDFATQMHNAPGLHVYRNNYRSTLLACIRDTYEKCWAWMGDDAFDMAAHTHIDAKPPTSWTLDAYGHDFPDTLRALYPEDPEIADMAWLEWAMRRAFDGADATPVDVAQLDGVNWEQVCFTMIPTLKLGDVTTNAAALWSALDAEETPPRVETFPAPVTLCVWRQDLSPCFRTLKTTDAQILRMAHGGASFGSICDLLARQNGVTEAANLAGAALGQWLSDGFIAKFNSSF